MHSLTQLDDYNHLLMAISEKDFPCIHQIIDVALRHGSSVWKVVNKLEDALEGAYTPRGYGADDIDIATLSTFTSIVPTIGPIRNEQFDQNIQNIVISTRAHLEFQSLCGVSLMIDEIALEEMAVHFSKYNKVGGLCWKHSHIVEPILHAYEGAVDITQKIHSGELHLGKELTVIGASCFGEDEIYPILAVPTCKNEGASDMESILARAIDCWDRTGASTSVGSIWSLATDGDATRRAAGHKLFVKLPLPMESPLYGMLSNMPGLNLCMGENEVTLDFNFKHVFKYYCTLIWSPAGIVLNNGCVINSMMLMCYLVWLPTYGEAAVMKLLHLDDPQDVPRAVELMLAIIDFSHSQSHRRADLVSISLLSALLESILTLFINNTVFCLPKQQVLDPHAHFYLGDIGDDPLEILFGRTCMIGGHNSACSYAQAIDHLGAAKDIDGFLNVIPSLIRGIGGVDHINCEIWKGDIIAGRCDLPLAWRRGRDAALTILSKSQLDPVHYSFTAHFSNPTIDMMRPFRQNKYFSCLETILGDEGDGELQPECHDDEELMLNFQEALIDESPSDAPFPAPSHQLIPANPTLLTPQLPHGPGIRPDDYLLYNGRWIHKQTVC
ncbi:hypothetical protein P692DRAFT_201842448 [Suillus brevipes Sb2]|nr:hypothetical protein P692DRAFT_201842448 [Suillus brevipes Sb2]